MALRVCTIIARNYWAHARVLARSVIDHHPDAEITVLVVDPDASTRAMAARERFSVLGPDDIGLDRTELLRMAGIYDVLELSTALKPSLLRTLLQRAPEPVVYLDPDIEVFSSLEDLNGYANDHGIVLTPHAISPLPLDDYGPSELTILQAGTYNLGFIAVGSGATDFLDWWAQRLARDCLISKEQGMFVDQKWIDLVPNYFDPYVLREPGWNVAYWNLPARMLEHGPHGYIVDGRPLRFFHFSGFDADRPDLLSYFQGDDPRIRLDDHPALAEVCDHHARELIAAGHRGWSRLRYPFDRTSTGLRLDHRARAVYRAALMDAERAKLPEPANPFDSGAAFERWLNQIVGPHEITRYLMQLWHERAELKQAFPEIEGDDARLFVDWVRSTGALHENIPDRLVPRPVATPPIAGMNIAGYMAAENGVGEAARQMIRVLDAADTPRSVVTYRNTRSRQGLDTVGTEPDVLYDVNLVCVNADQIGTFHADAPRLWEDGRYTIGSWAWEVETLPDWMRGAFEHVNEIWMYSEHSARAVRPLTDKPVFVCPPPVPVPVVQPRPRSELGLPADGFLFLFCFDFDSVFERKNPLAVVEAFRRAFPRPVGPQLVIKSVRGDAHPDDLIRLRGAASGRSDIHIMDGYLDADAQHALMAACDAYVSLHRAEGFGFTVAEAMALGKPVIATGYSGTMEFTDDTNAWLVAHELVEIGPGCDPYPADGVWADPDLDAAARAMREVIDDPHLAAERGRRAAADIVRLHDPASRAPLLIDRLEAITLARLEAGDTEGGRPWTAVDSADYYLATGPDLGSPTRYGFFSRTMRRFVMRFVRHFAEHQDRVQHSLIESVRDLQGRLASETAAVRELESKLRDLEARLPQHADMVSDVRQLPPIVPPVVRGTVRESHPESVDRDR